MLNSSCKSTWNQQLLYKPKRYRGTVLTQSGLQKLYAQIQQLSADEGCEMTPRRIAERTQRIEPQGLNAATVRKILQAQTGVDQDSIRLVFQALNLTLEPLDFNYFYHIRTEQAAPFAVKSQSALNHPVYLTNAVGGDRCIKGSRQEQLPKIDLPEYPGSPLPLNSRFYVERSAIQTQAYAQLHKSGSLTWIRAPHKMGKSSLLLRIHSYAKQLNNHTVHLDFQQADRVILSDLNKLLRWMCKTISLQLQIECCLEQHWDNELGSKVSFIVCLHHLLAQLHQPFVLSLNEVNRLFEYPDVCREFLLLLRSLNEEAKYDEVLQNLRLILAYSTDACISANFEHQLLNIGMTLHLPEFSIAEVQQLALVYQLPWENSSLIAQLMEWVGGHPYLIQLAFYHLTTSIPPASVDTYQLQQLMQQATISVGIYQYHLQQVWSIVQADLLLLAAVEQLISQEGIIIESSIARKLECLGIARPEGDRTILRGRLYQKYFQKKNSSLVKLS
ncbi:AAA-like domain-containing protein [Gloeocapsa sp. BRSZ]